MYLPDYQFFGSEDSQDIDVAFFIEKMPESTHQCATLNKTYCQALADLHHYTKPVNGNLVVVQDGSLRHVFKGTTDELNNALFYTYSLHYQYVENKITSLLKRDVDLKFLRCTRTILSYFTKTAHRKEIKLALDGDIDLKYEVLRNLNLLQSIENQFLNVNIIKSIAFQLGQTLALNEGKELYTKNEIAAYFPSLKPFLYRNSKANYLLLNELLLIFLDKLAERRKTMQDKFEYGYRF